MSILVDKISKIGYYSYMQSKTKKKSFGNSAKEFVVQYLNVEKEASGEQITNACKDSGLRPPDDRAFGPVFRSLMIRNVIEKGGTCPREKSRCSTGGHLWRLKK